MTGQEREGVNPFADLPALGGQWAEARGFLRTFGKNPYAQEALVRALSGLWKTAVEELRPNSNSVAPIEQQVIAESAKSILLYMREQLPEWADLGPVKVDPELFMPDYSCEPHLKEYVEQVILEGSFDNGGVQ